MPGLRVPFGGNHDGGGIAPPVTEIYHPLVAPKNYKSFSFWAFLSQA